MDRIRQRSIETYRRKAAGYNSRSAVLGPFRERAVARLGLEAGHVVLEAGCGTGLNFPFLQRAIGPSGQIIGIDQSPDMLLRAQKQVHANGWRNVTLIQAAAEQAEIVGEADAVLFFLVQNILRSPAALGNILGMCGQVQEWSRAALGQGRGGPSTRTSRFGSKLGVMPALPRGSASRGVT